VLADEEISTGPPLSPWLIGFHLSVSFFVNTQTHGGTYGNSTSAILFEKQ
jgi:hypothetical protein